MNFKKQRQIFSVIFLAFILFSYIFIFPISASARRIKGRNNSIILSGLFLYSPSHVNSIAEIVEYMGSSYDKAIGKAWLNFFEVLAKEKGYSAEELKGERILLLLQYSYITNNPIDLETIEEFAKGKMFTLFVDYIEKLQEALSKLQQLAKPGQIPLGIMSQARQTSEEMRNLIQGFQYFKAYEVFSSFIKNAKDIKIEGEEYILSFVSKYVLYVLLLEKERDIISNAIIEVADNENEEIEFEGVIDKFYNYIRKVDENITTVVIHY
jgi:hypothetical protein